MVRGRSCSVLAAVAFVLAHAAAASAATPGKVTKEHFAYGHRDITYYFYLPRSVTTPASAPLLVLFHGSGQYGSTLVEPWKKLAEKEGVVLLGPDSDNREYWYTPTDGPAPLCALVDEIRRSVPIVDSKRIYLFGHSAGAVFTLYMATLESEYFAAAALHAGAWRTPEEFATLQAVRRTIPVALTVGDLDRFFPLAAVTGTVDELKKTGLPVEYKIMRGHNHNYYLVSDQVNAWAWTFLKGHALDAEPKYVQHRFQ